MPVCRPSEVFVPSGAQGSDAGGQIRLTIFGGVPDPYRTLVSCNPIAIIVSDSRAAIFYGTAPQPLPLVLTLLGALIIFDLGFRFFNRAKEVAVAK